MVQVIVEADQVIFTVEGWDRLWGLRTRLTIPAAHIRSVRRGALQLHGAGVGHGWVDSAAGLIECKEEAKILRKELGLEAASS